jgi:hypothetical protein
MDTIVCEVSVLQQLSMSTRPVWELPLMDHLAVDVYQVDGARAGEVGEERVSWRHVMRVKSAQAKTPADECALLHGC